jgi:RecB family exonuclease
MNFILLDPRDTANGLPDIITEPQAESTVEKPAPILLSATRVKLYLQCPRQYRYRYVEEIPTPLTGALAFGKVIHQVLYNLQLWAVTHGEPFTESIAWYDFSRLWAETVTTQNPLFKNADEPGEYSALARLMLAGYVEAHREKPPPILLEYPFEIAMQVEDSGRKYLLRGVIDRIDYSQEGLVIVDYKTGKRKPSPRQLQEDLQLTIYAFAAIQLFGQDVQQLVYYHLRDQSELMAARDESELQTLTQVTLPQVADGIAGERFAPCPGYYCRFCDYRERCRAEGGVDLRRYEPFGHVMTESNNSR